MGEITVFNAPPRMVVGETVTEFKNRIEQELGEGRKTILLDMSGVTQICAGGIGIVVAMHTTAGRHDATVWLFGMKKHVHQLFEASGLSTNLNFGLADRITSAISAS